KRLPQPIEAAVYYVVSEALANVGKYAEASVATVTVLRADRRVLVEVSDDGVGGADAARGTGLRGLADRVESLDGRLEVESEPGGGPRVRAEFPLPWAGPIGVALCSRTARRSVIGAGNRTARHGFAPFPSVLGVATSGQCTAEERTPMTLQLETLETSF